MWQHWLISLRVELWIDEERLGVERPLLTLAGKIQPSVWLLSRGLLENVAESHGALVEA